MRTMTVPAKLFGQLGEIILQGAIQAIKFFNEKERVKATRRLYQGKQRYIEILFTIGRPNYAERKFIKRAKKRDKNCFPIAYINWPKK